MLGFSQDLGSMARNPIEHPESVAAIAKRLKLLRGALKLTQAVMARAIGSSTDGQLWGNYESGARRISTDHALALCRAFGVTMDWIYRGRIDLVPPDLREKIRFEEMKLEERQLASRGRH